MFYANRFQSVKTKWFCIKREKGRRIEMCRYLKREAAPMSPLRQRNEETEHHFNFCYLVIGANHSSILCACLFVRKLISSLFSTQRSSHCHSFSTHNETWGTTLAPFKMGLSLKVACAFKLPAAFSQVLNKTYSMRAMWAKEAVLCSFNAHKWWCTLMISQMYTQVPWGEGGGLHFVIVWG